jgi:polysaccharide export outer membrane protein
MNIMTQAHVSSPLRPAGESVFSVKPCPSPARSAAGSTNARPQSARILVRAVSALASLLLTACVTSKPMNYASAAPKVGENEPQTLHAGDVIKISFPRAPTLDTTQQIRRDGKINLSVVGEVNAAELSPAALETKLLELYAADLVSKEVRVTVVSSAFAVFVTGAVIHPGKLTPDRGLTAFEAIMEAGGFDLAKAETKAVTVIRQENGLTKNFTLNLKAVLDGKDSQPFYLQAYDVIFVPEKFSWF